MSFSAVFEIFNAQEEYTLSITNVGFFIHLTGHSRRSREEKEEAEKQLHEASDPEIKDLNRASNAILGTGTGSPHCLRVWTFQDQIS